MARLDYRGLPNDARGRLTNLLDHAQDFMADDCSYLEGRALVVGMEMTATNAARRYS